MSPRNKKSSFFCAALLALAALMPTAAAGDGNPGSVLLYPYYDTTTDIVFFSITNVAQDKQTVRLVFIDEDDCAPKEMIVKLTGYDTFTFYVSAMLGVDHRGFMYAHVIDKSSSNELHSDALVGQAVVIGPPITQGDLLNYTINAAAYKGINVKPDGLIHLDGTEYEAAPAEVYIPRFFGQFESGTKELFTSRIALINLTGGQHFETTARVYIYNDNEVVFSDMVKFGCFEIMPLTDVSMVTRNSFLLSTSHDLGEPFGFAGVVETGWMRIKGDYALNPDNGVVIENPSILGFVVERMGYTAYGADLPFHAEDPKTYHNAVLWSTDPKGNQ